MNVCHYLKNENVELHKRIDQLEALVNNIIIFYIELYHFFFYLSINNSVQQVLTLNKHIFLKNIYNNLNKKMDDYLQKINVNVKNMNDF